MAMGFTEINNKPEDQIVLSMLGASNAGTQAVAGAKRTTHTHAIMFH